ncbi:unnamed protein product [Lactuca virosa]|uniref:Secreted protein n=1 Tax=Lactuca virosa TaxID=75947 RepID=A0AAU9PRT6_9ASTR|nr:unnamed protein product [Lactuca virosa]
MCLFFRLSYVGIYLWAIIRVIHGSNGPYHNFNLKLNRLIGHREPLFSRSSFFVFAPVIDSLSPGSFVGVTVQHPSLRSLAWFFVISHLLLVQHQQFHGYYGKLLLKLDSVECRFYSTF